MRTKLRSKLSLLFVVFAVMLAFPAIAFAADGLNADADNLATGTANHSNSFSANQQPGTTQAYDFSAFIQDDGNDKNNVFAAAGDKVTATNTFSGDWLASSGSTASLEFTAYEQNKVGQIAIKVPCDATAGASKTMTVTLSASASNGKNLAPSSRTLSYTITASGTPDASCTPAPTNNPPVVDTAAVDALGTEGDTLQASGAFSDPDGHSLSLSADNTVGTFTDKGDGTWSWSLPTNDDVLPRGTITVTADDGNGGTVTDSFDYEAVNANPDIQNLSLNTGANNTACLNGKPVSLSFNIIDPGSADSHSATINWGDGNSTNIPDPAGSSVNEEHTYVGAGQFNISVTVNDDDNGTDTDNSLSGSGALNLSYNLSGLLAPVNANGSSVFKYGSTIPLKVKITDCENLPVSGLSPSIKFQKMNGSTPTANINETVSTSAADTSGFMRYDGTSQYIYNLASKSLLDPEATYRAVISEGSSTPNPLYSQNFGLKR